MEREESAQLSVAVAALVLFGTYVVWAVEIASLGKVESFEYWLVGIMLFKAHQLEVKVPPHLCCGQSTMLPSNPGLVQYLAALRSRQDKVERHSACSGKMSSGDHGMSDKSISL